MLQRSAVLASILLFFACTDSTPAPEPTNEPPKIAQGTDDDAPEAEPLPDPEPEPLGEAYVTVVTSMRKVPDTAYKVANPDKPGKKMSNWVATLHAGETVTVESQENDEWSKSRASDDSEGFLQSKHLVSVSESSIATLLEDTKVFNRPDLLALNASRTLEPGTLVFKLQEKDQFSEIRAGYRSEWILTEKLVSDEKEVEAAKLLAKARWLEEKKDDAYAPLMDLLKTQFSETKVVGYVDEQEAIIAEALAEDAAADAEEAPAEDAKDEDESE
ncbi:MAG: SH3 domain-containing protein [Myxococcota bacterium]